MDKKNSFKKLDKKNVFKNLGTGILAFQHMFAMLGATILVPMLAEMSISIALIAAGVGTILFYFITKKKVPVFLGSSFAFLPALISIVGGTTMYTKEWQAAMAAAMIAIVMAGLVYVILSLAIKVVGVKKIKKLFPPQVVGPVIILVGMILVPKMFYNNIINQTQYGHPEAWKHWTAAAITAITIIATNAYAPKKSFLKVVPILLGFIVGYIYSAIIGLISFKGVFTKDNIVIFQNLHKDLSFYKGFGHVTGAQVGSAILMIVPMAIVTFMEHLGDISANSTVCGQDFMVDPGLNRTILGDGVATIVSGLIGGPANTTYGENTAVLAITNNYNPKNIFYAACLAIFFGIFSVFGSFLSTIPPAVIGGASIILFGMISASGLRAMVEAKVDFGNSRNMIIVSVILSLGLGLSAMSIVGDAIQTIPGAISLPNGSYDPKVHKQLYLSYKMIIGSVEISPLAIATLAGIILNLIIPDKKEGEAQYSYLKIDNVENSETFEEIIIEAGQDQTTDEVLDLETSKDNDDSINEVNDEQK